MTQLHSELKSNVSQMLNISILNLSLITCPVSMSLFTDDVKLWDRIVMLTSGGFYFLACNAHRSLRAALERLKSFTCEKKWQQQFDFWSKFGCQVENICFACECVSAYFTKLNETVEICNEIVHNSRA